MLAASDVASCSVPRTRNHKAHPAVQPKWNGQLSNKSHRNTEKSSRPKRYGKIVSTKAILDKTTNKCKGYGFVDFDSPAAAQKAVSALKANGVQAQMAKLSSACQPFHFQTCQEWFGGIMSDLHRLSKPQTLFSSVQVTSDEGPGTPPPYGAWTSAPVALLSTLL
ncbi:hypothetical protein CB1_000290018 [Camelus ferus]|nr:hypothetical protein CB1_000290018 [Camelus ferus]